MKLLFQHLLTARHMAYVTLDSDLQIIEISDQAGRFADVAYPFKPLTAFDSSFPELIGMEADLQAVIQKERSHLYLHAITRSHQRGGLLYFDLYALSLNNSADFADSALILLLEDVTEQMTLEQKLVQASNEMSLLLDVLTASENYLDRIITSMADALIVTSPSGVIQTVNSAAKLLFGYGEEIINQPFAKLVADENFLFQIIQPQDDCESCKEFEMVCQTKTGEKRSIAFSGSGIFNESGLQNCIYIGRDITERQRTQQRFMAQYTTARILSDATNQHEAIAKLLPMLCQGLDWDLAELWLLGESDLRCVEAWAAIAVRPFIAATQQITFARGVGLPGRVWEIKAPQWVNDVTCDRRFMRSSLAAQAGLHAAFGFPIQSGEEILGVITFFCREVKPPDLDLLQTMVVIGNQLGQFLKRQQAEAALRREQERTEQLLLNVLPASIVDRLKQEQEQGTIAEHFADVTVLFADLVNFSQLAAALPPIALVNLLNQVFSAFDRLTERYGLEKIKTIGDAYMVVGGLPQRRDDHTEAIAAMALEMQVELACLNTIHRQSLAMRIGIHTGSVVAGVIGLKKFAYDLWGETVNLASRMESHGEPGRIQVTDTVYQRLRDPERISKAGCQASSHYRFVFERRGYISLKGQGEQFTYWLCDRCR